MPVDRVIVGTVDGPPFTCIFCNNVNFVPMNQFLYVTDKHTDKTYYICKYCARQIHAQFENSLKDREKF